MTPQEELDQLSDRLSKNHAKINGQVDTLVSRHCELCGYATTYNEDLQIWCRKKEREVFSGLELDCKYYES